MAEASKRPPDAESEGPDRSSYPKGSREVLPPAVEEESVSAAELLANVPPTILAAFLGSNPSVLKEHPGVVANLMAVTPGWYDSREHDVMREVARLEVREQAKAIFDAARRPPAEEFDAGTLAEMLARPEPPMARVDGMIPWNASTLLVAQRKAGKTTLCMNLAYSLITGEPFLGEFDVRPLEGRVGFLNFEVSGHQVAAWAHKRRVPRDRLFLVNLRGRPSPFRDPRELDSLAELLRAQEVETLIVDPFGRAYSGESQNDNGEVGRWLVGLDEFGRTGVGARDIILAAHSGWNPERSRGASALEDWPDSIMTLTRDEKSDLRFLRADGRDVTMPEDQLDWDPSTNALTTTGAGSRQVARDAAHADELIDALLRVIARQPGLNTSELEKSLPEEVGLQKGDVSKALSRAEQRGLIVRKPGKRGSKLHYLPGATTTEQKES